MQQPLRRWPTGADLFNVEYVFSRPLDRNGSYKSRTQQVRGLLDLVRSPRMHRPLSSSHLLTHFYLRLHEQCAAHRRMIRLRKERDTLPGVWQGYLPMYLARIRGLTVSIDWRQRKLQRMLRMIFGDSQPTHP